ncbi:hypothetical protein PoB_004195700 [Plakobranchus ocellatus]|uniref:Uncharacterized protein n=1 Tax=Plakobranchus ocellatus TaxID=259542 RepID=A0AAV4B8L0_9GAST|nr:hypothetical protein PoB_004195700 [Plakobranchus ocellatus]
MKRKKENLPCSPAQKDVEEQKNPAVNTAKKSIVKRRNPNAQLSRTLDLKLVVNNPSWTEIEQQKLERDERVAEREAEIKLQEEFEKQKQLDAQAKVPQNLSFSASSVDQSSSGSRSPVLGRRAWTSNTDMSSRRLLCHVCNGVGHLVSVLVDLLVPNVLSDLIDWQHSWNN